MARIISGRKILAPRTDNYKQFDSSPTRYFSLDVFCGDALLTGGDPEGPCPNPTDVPENLEKKWNSGVCRIDNVKMWGPVKGIKRKIGKVSLSDDAALDSFFRNKGEPVNKS